jgi:UDPglucose--hexose-1-phosphate uridylyltransferase
VADEPARCPFCAGREGETPPETYRVGDPWQVRVVPNLYPAFERQEVVVHTPRHLPSLAQLSDAQLGRVARAWQERAAAARRQGFPYVHAFVNEGRGAGASLSHSHSQLVWLREPPPAVQAERSPEALLTGEPVLEQEGVALICPYASRVPYEMLVAPAERQGEAFASDLLAPALRLAAEGLRRLRALHPEAPCNLWLHDGSWWHLEVFPRLTTWAGVELGAGIYLNPLPPEQAAAALRVGHPR